MVLEEDGNVNVVALFCTIEYQIRELLSVAITVLGLGRKG